MSFENFIRWIVGGNSAADEHWTPGSDLCLACSARYTFIAHSEHFNEDIMVRLYLGTIPLMVIS